MEKSVNGVKSSKNNSGKLILLCFVSFFGLIFVVNGIFAYMALSTHTGLVTKNAYEKGLAYNEVLQKVKNQPKLKEEAVYDSGVLRWFLADENNTFLENAMVSARIIRPVQGGYDFDVTLEYKGSGVYEAKLDLPLQGAWRAKLNSKWDNKEYQTTYNFVAN